jgi:hypothetical protein
MIKILPAAGGQLVENLLRALVPGPPDVAGKTVKVGDEFG